MQVWADRRKYLDFQQHLCQHTGKVQKRRRGMGFIQNYMIFVIFLMMFSLGLTLVPADFFRILRNPGPVFLGILCQMAGLPLVALLLVRLLNISPIYAMGLFLIACSPGGPGSNFFTAVARGDTALSVSLTAVTSLLTVFTMPLLLSRAAEHLSGTDLTITLRFLPTFTRMVLNILLPIVVAMAVRHRWEGAAKKVFPSLQRLSMVLLTLGIGGYVWQYFDVLVEHGPSLAGTVCLFLACTMGFGFMVSSFFRFGRSVRTAITIEIGIQNASQAILIALHPLLLNDVTYAFPSFFYGLLMYAFVIPFMYIEKKRNRLTVPDEQSMMG